MLQISFSTIATLKIRVMWVKCVCMCVRTAKGPRKSIFGLILVQISWYTCK